MSDLKKMTMSELIAKHNELNPASPVTEFKNLAAARKAVEALENPGAAPAEGEAPATGDTQKYNSSGKRGPTQGVGAFAKEQIAAGKNNAEVLEAVKAQFPTAKTTTSCIAYYRTAMKKGVAGPTPEELEAKANALIAQAQAAREAAAAKASLEVQAQMDAAAQAA